MILKNQFVIRDYEFSSNLFEEFNNNHFAKDLWPVVYILSEEKTKEAYIGETTDMYARMNAHLKNDRKTRLTSVHLITSEKFNKSATLDIEANLIKYISGDGIYQLQNGNLGLANHSYYQKNELYWDMFKSIWDSLRAEGLTKHSLDFIDNSDLFKYSPYKSLTKEQKAGLLTIVRSLLTREHRNIIIEGGAGTGKTILAIFLFKMLYSDNSDFNFKEFGEGEAEFVYLIDSLKHELPNPKMALVVPMASFRSTLKKVFKNIKGLSARMVIGPAEVTNEEYDILLVDESHRLRRRQNLGAYYGAFDKVCKELRLDKMSSSELDWILLKSKKTILFYDESQSIKPSDTKKEDFDKLKRSGETKAEELKSQFRVKGGNAYVSFVHNLLNCSLGRRQREFNSKDYELLLFDSVKDMYDQIKLRDDENGLSRLIAGYAWEWKSNKDPDSFDLEFDDIQLKWNTTSKDWINSVDSIKEVGCIHTTQGYDLNYAGVIFGHEITYDVKTNEIVIIKENYFDKNGKQAIENPQELKEFIINIYKTIMLRGIKGTYIYVCDKNLKEYLAQYIPEIKRKKKVNLIPFSKVIPFENSIPLYDLKVSAGDFGQIQQVEDVAWIQLPQNYRPSKDLFACQIIGESMNKVIPNGAFCLFRKYSGGSRNGRIVLAEHRDIQDADFGSCYTVKEYHSKKVSDGDEWRHDVIVLKPLSTDSSYQELVLQDQTQSSFKVIGIFESVL
ncbi:MAG: DNA/RNA helicase domain-containing protein [Saonia sp.]